MYIINIVTNILHFDTSCKFGIQYVLKRIFVSVQPNTIDSNVDHHRHRFRRRLRKSIPH